MKTILAFGDSLTCGYNAFTGMRMACEDRWPNVLAAGLHKLNRVIEPSMNETFSTDHRAGDGAREAELMGAIKMYLEEPRLM